jgi:hypothetical protein
MSHEEFSSVRELPGPLPPGERILWQGGPNWLSLFLHAFHGQALAIYFGLLLALRAWTVMSEGGTAAAAASSVLILLGLALCALSMIALLAWLTARASYYTITSARLVMHIGIVLEITFNLPFKVIESANLRRYGDDTGDIAVTFNTGDRIAYLNLWPHARPWRFKRTEPMMRAVPRPGQVAEILARALAESADSASRFIDLAPASNEKSGTAPAHAVAAR